MNKHASKLCRPEEAQALVLKLIAEAAWNIPDLGMAASWGATEMVDDAHIYIWDPKIFNLNKDNFVQRAETGMYRHCQKSKTPQVDWPLPHPSQAFPLKHEP